MLNIPVVLLAISLTSVVPEIMSLFQKFPNVLPMPDLALGGVGEGLPNFFMVRGCAIFRAASFRDRIRIYGFGIQQLFKFSGFMGLVVCKAFLPT